MTESRGGRALVAVAVVEGVLIALLGLALMLGGEASQATPNAPDLPADDPSHPSADPISSETFSEDDRDDPVRPEEVDIAPASKMAATHTVLLGRLVDQSGVPPSQGHISVTPAAGTSSVATTYLRNGRSTYAIPGLEPGRYRIRVTATGYRELQEELEIPKGVDRLRHDLVLSKTWQLRVLIATPEGQPLHEAIRKLDGDQVALRRTFPYAVATIGAPPSPLPPTDRRRSPIGFGRWLSTMDVVMGNATALPKRYAGYLELPEDRPLTISAVMRTAVLASAEVEAAQPEVTLTVPLDRLLSSLCTVRMQIVDGETGEPVTKATVSLSDAQSSSSGQPVDAEGRIELTHQLPGLLNVDVSAPGRIIPRLNVELRPGDVVDLGALPVYDIVRVKGRVEGMPPGERKPSVTALSLDASLHPALRARSHRGQVEPDGTFALRIPSGRYHLRVSRRGAAELEFSTRDLRDEPLVVSVQPEAVLHLLPPPQDRRLQLTVIDARERQVWRRWLTWTGPVDVPFLPGAYTLEITDLDGKIERRRVQLGVGKTELDLR